MHSIFLKIKEISDIHGNGEFCTFRSVPDGIRHGISITGSQERDCWKNNQLIWSLFHLYYWSVFDLDGSFFIQMLHLIFKLSSGFNVWHYCVAGMLLFFFSNICTLEVILKCLTIKCKMCFYPSLSVFHVVRPTSI